MNFHPSTLGFLPIVQNQELQKTFQSYKNNPIDKAKPITGEKPRSLLQLHPIPDQKAKIQNLKNESWVKKEPYVDPRTVKMEAQNEKLREIQKEEFKVRTELMRQLVNRKHRRWNDIRWHVEESILRIFSVNPRSAPHNPTLTNCSIVC